MILLVMIFSIFLSILMYYKHRTISYPTVFFNIVWSFVYTFTFINISEYYEVSNKALLIMFIGQLFFNLGGLFKFRLKRRVVDDILNENFILSNKIVILQLIILIFMLPFVIKALESIAIYGFTMQRYYFATNETAFFSSMQRLIYIYLVIFPLNKAISLLCVADLIYNKKISFKLIFSVVLMVCETIITAGRFTIVDILFCFLFVYFMRKKRNKKDKENKKLSRLVITVSVAVLIGIMVVSSMRTLKDESMLKILFVNTIEYFTMGPRLLDMALSNPNFWGLNDVGLGGFTIAGLMEIIRLLFAFLHIPINLNFFSRSQEVVGIYRSISYTGKTANAFPTMYYYFIRDFSYFGIVLIPFILGIICASTYKAFKRNNSVWSALKYSYLMLLILYSSCWWNAIRPEYWACFIWLLIIKYVFIKRGNSYER